MSDRTGTPGLFSRARTGRPPEPKPDQRAAPYGWMWDTAQGKWRAKKRAGRTPNSAKGLGGYKRPTTVAGRATRSRKKGPKSRPPAPAWTETAPEPEPGEQVPAEELRDLDPAPAWQEEPGEPVPEAPSPAPTGDVRAEIRALVALTYSIPAEPLSMLDPYCFGPLDEPETAIPIVDAITDIVCSSPTVAAWAASASGLRPWIRLGIALKPVAKNVIKHHITRSVEVTIDREAKEYSVQKRDFSQYTAA